MKINALCCFILTIGITVNAQIPSPYLPFADSNPNASELEKRNEELLLDSVYRYRAPIVDPDNWMLESKEEYGYNEQNLNTSIIELNWFDNLQTFSNDSKDEFRYNEQNQLIEQTNFGWIGGSFWAPFIRNEYAEYNEQGDFEFRAYYVMDQSTLELVLNSEYEYSYVYLEGSTIFEERIERKRLPGGEWNNSMRSMLVGGSNTGNRSYTFEAWNEAMQTWEYVSRIDYEYEGAFLKQETQFSWRQEEQQFDTIFTYINEDFNEDDLVDRTIITPFNNPFFDEIVRDDYFYSTAPTTTNTQSSFLDPSIIQMSNPYQKGSPVEVLVAGDYLLSVTNLLGQPVYQQTVLGPSKFTLPADLPADIYFLNLQERNGKKHKLTLKFIVP